MNSKMASQKKLGLISLIGIIGAGIYNLMSNMAATSSAEAVILGWIVARIGMGP